MMRYADDFVVLCKSEEEARAALARIEHWTAQAGLKLHPEKTPRRNGKSLTEIIQTVNATLRGWFEYFKHSFKDTFTSLRDRLQYDYSLKK